MAGSSQIHKCIECGKMFYDGGDLHDHMRVEHEVRIGLATPVALIFIDALGNTLPFKTSFTFKELNDFCHREGVTTISESPLTGADLIKIAESVAHLTNNHIEIKEEPTRTGDRTPLSSVDLGVAQRRSSARTCRRCPAIISSSRILCDDCRRGIAAAREEVSKPIALYANVTLKDGARLHVVDIQGESYVGVDDLFEPRVFSASEAEAIHNLDDDIHTVKSARCSMCGEDTESNTKCSNCGYNP